MARSDASENQDICNIMCNKVRLRIAQVLYERVEVPYSELASLVGVSESLLNHHLKRMSGLVEKGRSGYRLTWRGREVYRIVQSLAGGEEEPQARQASLHRRILAFIIDVLVFFISTGAILDPHMIAGLGGLAAGIAGLDPTRITGSLASLIDRSIIGYSNVFFAAFIFLTLLEAYNGQTLGKHLLHLRVVRIDGSRLTLVEAGIRNAGKIFLLPVDLVLGLALYRRRGYIRLTDYLVRAIVVDERPKRNLEARGGDGRRAQLNPNIIARPGG